MKFAPEYVTNVLNDNFEDAKELLLSPLMAINYAHLVMLAETGIIPAADAGAELRQVARLHPHHAAPGEGARRRLAREPAC